MAMETYDIFKSLAIIIIFAKLLGIGARRIRIPQVVGEMVRSGRASVAVLPTNDKWFGVTYKEDKPLFVESIKQRIAAGDFPESTFQ